MKRFTKHFTTLFMVLLALFLIAPASHAAMSDMWADVYSWDGGYNADGTIKLTQITSGVTYQVLAVGADTEETLYVYNDNTYTSYTNAVTTTYFNAVDRVQFRVDPTDATSDRYVDMIVVDTAGGYTAFIDNFDKYTHTIVIDERPNVQHHGCIWYAPSSAVETDTGIDFDYDTLLTHVGIEAVTVDATETLDVGLLSTGTGGDADGLVDGASVATAGCPLITLTTSGALMDDGANFDPDGHYVISANEQSLTYTGSGGSDTAAGYIHYFFTRTR